MKPFFLLIFFTFCLGWNKTQAQTYNLGHTTITFNDASRSGGFGSGGGSGRQIQTEIYYPANINGNNVAVASGYFPVVVFGHGFAMAWDAYENVWEDLASKGYIIAFPRTEGSLLPAPDHNDFGLDLALVEVKMQALNTDATSLFFQKTIQKSAIIGHSMGGGATFLGAANNNSTSLVTVIGLAPAETNPSAINAALNVNLDALILSGSSDGVTPPNDNHLPIYQNVNANCKTFISITNGSHCYFANSNFNCDFGEFTTGTGSLPRGDQQDISSDYMNLWLAYKLKEDCAAFTYFQDSLSISPRITSLQTCATTPVSNINIDTSLCFGNSYTLNGSTYSSTGLYRDTLPNSIGCDSILYELTLNVLNQDSSYDFSLSCNPMDTGSFFSVFTNQFLCDSFHLSEVDLAPYALTSLQLSTCDSLEILGIFYDQDTIFQDTITGGSANGCDSITVFNLTISNSSYMQIEAFICSGDSFLLPNGSFTDTAGIFTFNLSNNFNCDSILSIEVFLEDQLIIDNSDFELYYTAEDTLLYYFNPSYSYDSIIWQDGINQFLFSSGDTGIYYSGNVVDAAGFKALVYSGTCVQSYSFIITTIKDQQEAYFTLFPNPANNFVQISAEDKITSLQIINNLGQIKKEVKGNQKNYLINTANLSNGIYLLKTNLGTKKIIILH